MNWIALKESAQIELLREESKNQPVLIFKHSTRCSISHTALTRLERNWKTEEIPSVKAYYLDLISYRDISNRIENLFEVEHQSPQILLLKDGEAVFHRSHFDIDFASIKNAVLTSAPVKN